jgi:hypothetical protein
VGTYAFLFQQVSGDLYGPDVDVAVALVHTGASRRHYSCRSGEVSPPYPTRVAPAPWLEALLGRSSLRWATLDAAGLSDLVWPHADAEHFTARCVTTSGMTLNEARAIALELRSTSSRFGGAIELDARNAFQTSALWTLLSPRVRVVGHEVRVLARGEEMPSLPDDLRTTTLSELFQQLKETGQFADVLYEDQGARGTVFDPGSDAFEDWAPLALEQLLGDFSALSASDLALRLHSFAPEAGKELRAAVASLAGSVVPADAAQISVSVRRCYEALADALYPPVEGGALPNGRPGGPGHYKNRLWAYIEASLPGQTARQVAFAALEDLGARVDAINATNQKGVHAQTTVWEAFRLCQALVWFAWDLLSLRPLPVEVDDREALGGLRAFFEAGFAPEDEPGVEE